MRPRLYEVPSVISQNDVWFAVSVAEKRMGTCWDTGNLQRGWWTSNITNFCSCVCVMVNVFLFGTVLVQLRSNTLRKAPMAPSNNKHMIDHSPGVSIMDIAVLWDYKLRPIRISCRTVTDFLQVSTLMMGDRWVAALDPTETSLWLPHWRVVVLERWLQIYALLMLALCSSGFEAVLMVSRPDRQDSKNIRLQAEFSLEKQLS